MIIKIFRISEADTPADQKEPRLMFKVCDSWLDQVRIYGYILRTSRSPDSDIPLRIRVDILEV